MPTGLDEQRGRTARLDHIELDIVVPVYNEEEHLEANIEQLAAFLDAGFPLRWRITIADNASTDSSWAISTALAARDHRVHALHLRQKGRGRALREAWTQSDADIVAYMDVDLSTRLEALLPLVAPLITGHSDVAIGSRLARGSRVVRGPKREFISRTYNQILRLVLRTQVRDAQCGFKAIRADVARRVLPMVEDNTWFFDTELLVVAERAGFRIAEIPVDWVDDPDSRVDIMHTALGDLRGVLRMAWTFWFHPEQVPDPECVRVAPPVGTGGELVSFMLVGLLSTVLYLIGYLVLEGRLGPYWANALSLSVTMILNTSANRRWTFGQRDPRSRLPHYVRATAVHLVGLALTTGAVWLLEAVTVTPGIGAQLVVLGLTSAVATALRFVLMPAWIFRDSVRTETRS